MTTVNVYAAWYYFSRRYAAQPDFCGVAAGGGAAGLAVLRAWRLARKYSRISFTVT